MNKISGGGWGGATPEATGRDIGQLLAPYCPSSYQGNRQTNNNQHIHLQSCRFDGHDDAPVYNRAHRSMEEVQGFTRSHWTLPLGKCYVL
jgi:hypothetical protein